MFTCTLEDLRLGMRIYVVDQKFNEHMQSYVASDFMTEANELSGQEAMVVSVDPKRTGKVVGLCLKNKNALGHTCDGIVPMGHGVWALPGHVYTKEMYEKHKVLADKAEDDSVIVKGLLEDFIK